MLIDLQHNAPLTRNLFRFQETKSHLNRAKRIALLTSARVKYVCIRSFTQNFLINQVIQALIHVFLLMKRTNNIFFSPNNGLRMQLAVHELKRATLSERVNPFSFSCKFLHLAEFQFVNWWSLVYAHYLPE